MNFVSGTYLAALAFAAGPVIIHLLNRRRYRTLEWAAMDFLREAIHRNRRILVFRDLLLLILRTLAVILFVLALAQPRRLATQAAGPAGQPMHAVLAIDNSLSMGYTQLDKTLLDVAKDKARAFIQALPDGSKVSLVPMCEYAGWYGKDVHATKEDALESLSRIELVDRASRSTVAAEAVARASRAAKNLPTKRVVFIGDIQTESWAAENLAEFFKDVPDVQVVQVSAEKRSNTWVADLRLRDGIADAKSPSVFLATLRHQGADERANVRVTLKISDEVIEERLVDLLPAQSLEVMFKHTFDDAGPPGEPLFVAARVELSPDHLPDDDHRTIVVPVVARVPVVFIDALGRDERPRLNRYGETYPLRRLLAPRTGQREEDRQLVEIRHRKPGEVTQDDLKDARLVGMAGVKSPPERLIRLLREYVEQGGVLFLAAGGQFDPAAWQRWAWLDGAGILPAPLKPMPVGKIPPPEAVDADVFRLAPATMQDAVFHLEIPRRELEEIFLTPFFYKAVAADMEAAAALAEAERTRIQARRDWLAQNDKNEKSWAELERKGQLTAEQRTRREADRKARAGMRANWLLWAGPPERDPAAMSVEELIQRTLPRVMGRYDNGEVFAVRRDIALGRVILITTGCYPAWNNLAAEHSVLLLDQALRHLLARSLPKRTFGAVNEIIVPIDSADQGAVFKVRAPEAGEDRPMAVEALGENTYGLIVRSVSRRGLVRLKRLPTRLEDGKTLKDDGWEMLLAVNGPSEESELACLDEDALAERMGEARFRWIEPDEEIRLEGVALIGHDYWKYLMAMALACLVIEMLFLAAPRLARRAA